MSQTVYTIAVETSECYGHGDYGTELRIVRTGAYGTGDFPPAFTDKAKAESYLRQKHPFGGAKVVPLELIP